MFRRHCAAAAAGAAAAATTAAAAATVQRTWCGARPPDFDVEHAKMLGRQCIAQESQAGYMPPSASWPQPHEQPTRSEIPALRRSLEKCGGIDVSSCHATAFSLSVALLGGALFGHGSNDDEQPSEQERAAGAQLMRDLAARGSLDGMCGWAYCCFDGEVTPQDVHLAVDLLKRAALLSHAQAAHELGVIFYTGEWRDEGVPEDAEQAVRWLREGAARGISGSMYLLGECLLSGQGVSPDPVEAFAWLLRAGELGHRGARARVLEDLEDEVDRRKAYGNLAGRKASEWRT